jgi:hypothetical protein
VTQGLERPLLVDNGILPAKHAHRYDLQFLAMFKLCVEHVTFKLLSPHSEELGSTAEELALAGLFRCTPIVLDENENIIPEEVESGIESELSDLHSLMMEDPDYEFLFDPRFDGFEGMSKLRVVNLEFNKWFEPFNKDRTVHWQLPTWTPLEPSFSDEDEDEEEDEES